MNNKNQGSLDYLLEIDSSSKKCNDKIKVVSLFHGTGHITLTSRKGKEFKTKLADLVSELLIDQNNEIVRAQATLFENFVIFKYPEKRSDEFDKIVQKAKLKVLETMETDLGCFEVTVQIDNVNLDLVEFIPQRGLKK